MTTNTWNVYKIFASGKVAKKPVFQFSHEDEESAFQFFETNVKPTFTPKQQKSRYTVVPDGKVPESTNAGSEEERVLLQKRQKALQRYLKESGEVENLNAITDFALILAKETDWKWQWAAVERVTCKYLLGISPVFTSYTKAVDWIDEQT
jgi:hypothetical protein